MQTLLKMKVRERDPQPSRRPPPPPFLRLFRTTYSLRLHLLFHPLPLATIHFLPRLRSGLIWVRSGKVVQLARMACLCSSVKLVVKSGMAFPATSFFIFSLIFLFFYFFATAEGLFLPFGEFSLVVLHRFGAVPLEDFQGFYLCSHVFSLHLLNVDYTQITFGLLCNM